VKAGQAVLFKPMHPVLHRAGRIAEHAGRFAATNAMGYQQHAMEAVVVSRLIRSADFVLQGQDHGVGITNLQGLHGHIEAQPADMRNYL
jgi:hypothetical protein